MNKETKQLIIDTINACDSLLFSTITLDGYPETRHVMNNMNFGVSDIDLHFMTNKKSPKYQQLLKDPHCSLYYFDIQTRQAIRLFGSIEIIDDQSEKIKYWRDEYKVYGYADGLDPDYALLKFVPKSYKFYLGYELRLGEF